MGTPTFEKNDVVDVKKGAVTYRHVWIRKAEGGRYEGTYRTKARGGNPATRNSVAFTGAQVTASYEKILARYGE
jgi:hypothetical protein